MNLIGMKQRFSEVLAVGRSREKGTDWLCEIPRRYEVHSKGEGALFLVSRWR